jgi:hypothetical protein
MSSEESKKKSREYYKAYINRPEVKQRIEQYNSRDYYCDACDENLRVNYKKRHEQTQKHEQNSENFKNIK